MRKLDELLNEFCHDVVEWRPLEDCCNILDKKRRAVTKSARKLGEYPYYGANGIQDYVSDYIFDGKFVLVGEDGSVLTPNGTPVVTWAEGKIWVNNHAHIIEEIEGVLLRYLFHYIQTINISKLIHGNIPKLTGKDFKALQIPIPPLEVQREISHILDNFTELTAELIAELTAELTDRKKQYEYYKEQLFNLNEETVDYVCLGDEIAGKFTRGSGLQKKDFTDLGVGCIHYGQIYTYYGTYTEKTKSFVSEEFAQKARKAKCGDLIIATTSENDEDLCKAVAWLGEDDIAVSSDACFYTHNLNPKYVAYFFQTEQFQKQKRQFITGTKVRRVNVNNLEKIKIPIPYLGDINMSLKEQQRIVDILDRFDILCRDISKGLTAEIEERQNQYEYYRDKILKFNYINKGV